MSTALATLTNKLAAKFGMDNADGVMDVLKATAFKGQVSDAQMTALMVVANQYGLNPWTKEIYAFPDRQNGIVPVVGVDGWSRIINEHPQFDGIDFEMTDDACTCIIYRKDRQHPTKVTEYLAECKRDTGPWKSHPRRMLRHKSMIQAARLAFGYTGIYEQDEAERIIEEKVISGEVIKPAEKPALEPCSETLFATFETKFKPMIQSGEKTANALIEWASAKTILSDEQRMEIASWEGKVHENA